MIDVIKEVETLICDINNIFLIINQSFKKSASYNKINLKKNCVKDIAENNEFLQTIYEYRVF